MCIPMKKYNDVEVVINNRQYTLCGYESDAYLQMVAKYLNDKHMEMRNSNNFLRLEQDVKSMLVQLNIADDYFKEKEKLQKLEEDLEKKENEISELKHENISLQSKLDVLQSEVDKLKLENLEAQKKMVKLETELENSKHYDYKKRR